MAARASQVVVAQGESQPRGVRPDRRAERARSIDFSRCEQRGTYVLAADGETSRPVRHRRRASTSELRVDALNYFYPAQRHRDRRATAAPELQPRRRSRRRRAQPGRHGGAVHRRRRRRPVRRWTCDYTLDVTGGWYDAGDHGKYVVNGGIAVAQLLSTYERTLSAPTAEPAALGDGSLRHPRGGQRRAGRARRGPLGARVDDEDAGPGRPAARRHGPPQGATTWTGPACPCCPATTRSSASCTARRPRRRSTSPPSRRRVRASSRRTTRPSRPTAAARPRRLRRGATRTRRARARRRPEPRRRTLRRRRRQRRVLLGGRRALPDHRRAAVRGRRPGQPLHTADSWPEGFDWGETSPASVAPRPGARPDRPPDADRRPRVRRRPAPTATWRSRRPSPSATAVRPDERRRLRVGVQLRGPQQPGRARDRVRPDRRPAVRRRRLESMDYLLGRNALNNSYVTGLRGRALRRTSTAAGSPTRSTRALPTRRRGRCPAARTRTCRTRSSAACAGRRRSSCYVDDIGVVVDQRDHGQLELGDLVGRVVPLDGKQLDVRVSWAHRRRPGHHRGASGRTGGAVGRRASVEPDGAGPSQPQREWSAIPDRDAGKRGGTAVVPVRGGRPRRRASHRQETTMTAAPRYPLHRPASSVPASPDLPALEKDVLAFWKARRHLPGVDRRSARRRAEQRVVFYDGPPFANGLPHYGHLLTGYAKDVFPRYQTMRGKQVDRRFGWDTHGLPAELEAERQLGITDKSPDRGDGHRRLQRRRPRVGAAVHRASGRTTSPARRAGSTSSTTTRRSTSTFMESVLWAFKTPLRQGPRVRGLPRAAVLLARRDAAVQPRAAHGRRRLQDAPGPVASPSPSRSRREGRGARAHRRARSPGRRRRGRCRRTSRSPSVPTSTYVVVAAARGAADVTALRRASVVAARGRSRRGRTTPKELGYEDDAARVARDRARARARGPSLRPPLRLLRRRRAGARTPGASSSPTTSPPRTAPASSTRPRPTVRTTSGSCEAAGIPLIMPVDDGGRFPPRCRMSPGSCVRRDANTPLIRILPPGATGACCARRATSTPTRTAGAAGTR